MLKHLLQETTTVTLSPEFLKETDAMLHERDMSLIRSESKIDFKNPLAQLITSFASVREQGETCSIMSFETKPKSGVTEYVPSVTRQYVETHREELVPFFSREEGKLAERFLSN